MISGSMRSAGSPWDHVCQCQVLRRHQPGGIIVGLGKKKRCEEITELGDTW